MRGDRYMVKMARAESTSTMVNMPAGGLTVRTYRTADAAAWEAFVLSQPQGTVFHLQKWSAAVDLCRRENANYLELRHREAHLLYKGGHLRAFHEMSPTASSGPPVSAGTRNRKVMAGGLCP